MSLHAYVCMSCGNVKGCWQSCDGGVRVVERARNADRARAHEAATAASAAAATYSTEEPAASSSNRNALHQQCRIAVRSTTNVWAAYQAQRTFTQKAPLAQAARKQRQQAYHTRPHAASRPPAATDDRRGGLSVGQVARPRHQCSLHNSSLDAREQRLGLLLWAEERGLVDTASGESEAQ